MKIKLNHINCFYGSHQALKDVSFSFPLGETIVLLGQSGAGKSSLLKIFNLLESPTSGNMSIDDMYFDFSKAINETDIRHLRKNVGMVFQNYNLWPHLSVLENLIEAPCQVLKMSKADASEKAIKILSRLQIDDMASRYPLHLSGGQQQRVAIARALMMEPKILLFDEPTAALDPAITAQVAEIINELSQTGISQVIVTHEVEFARKVASQFIYMERGEIIEQGQVDCFENPQTQQFKAYLSH